MMLAQYATEVHDKERLLKFGKFAKSREWKIDEFGIFDVLGRCPSLKVDSSTLVYYLKPLRARTYSIASSFDYTKEILGTDEKIFVDLVVTAVEFKIGPQDFRIVRRERKGFCSDFLANLEVGSELSMYLGSSPKFHLPDPSSPKEALLLGKIHASLLLYLQNTDLKL